MTACVNRKHTKKVAAVVTASLVGALSLGVAPVAAMATEGIDMQFVEGGTNEGAAEFTNGTVTFDFDKLNADGSTTGITSSKDADGIETVTADNLPLIVSATKVKPAGSQGDIAVNPGNDFSIQVFRADEDGNPTGSPLAGNRVTDAGEYVIAITPLTGSDHLGQTFTDRFNVAGLDLPTGLVAYEGQNAGDTEFVFTGSDLDVNVKYPNPSGPALLLEEGTDYTIEWYKGSAKVDGVKDAGTYVGKLVGKGKYAGSEGSVTVTVLAFNLSTTLPAGTVTVLRDDFTGTTPSDATTVYYTKADGTVTVLDPSMVTLEPTASVSGASETPVTFNVKPSAAAGSNVTGVTTTTACKVDRLATYTYAGKALQDNYDLDASKKETFDVADIKAMFGDTAATATIEVVKTGYALVDTAGATDSDKAINDLKAGKLGTYTITVDTTPDTIGSTVYGGSKTFTVRVWKGFIDCDTDLYCYGLDWGSTVAITSYAKGYDGEALTADSFWIRKGDLSASTYPGMGLDSALYDADGNEVDSAVDAGEYTLVVTSDEYKLTGSEGSNVLPITIGKVDLTTARIGELLKWNDVAGQEYLPSDTYVTTPSTTAINKLGLVYASGNDGADYEAAGWDGDDWAGEELLPGYVVNVQVEVNDEGTWKPVAKVEPSDAGQYRVTLSVSDDVISNFVLPEGENSVTLEFTVAKKNRFSDVQPSDWFYGAVNDAAAQGYVHGDAGLTTFRPNAAIKRGEVAVILYNMSGMSKWWQDNENNSGSYVDGQGWKTGFDDVDSTMYYAEAIAWAKKTGVINGDAGTKNFRPEDTVTNEEFAAMLANYAEKVNMDDTVANADVASLEGVKGADGITEWAKKSVAWAVENEVMGNNGADILATQNTTRARVAAMCVNYQPEAK